jgi:hypothetical protein
MNRFDYREFHPQAWPGNTLVSAEHSDNAYETLVDGIKRTEENKKHN